MSEAKRNKEKKPTVTDIHSTLDLLPIPQLDLTRKKSLIFIICVAMAGGLTRFTNFSLPLALAVTPPTSGEHLANNDPLISGEISAYPRFSTSFSTINSLPKCATTDSPTKCVEKICDEVAKTLYPLNKPRVGEKKIRTEDNEKLNKMITEATQEKEKGVLAFWERFREGYGSKIDSRDVYEMAQFLALRAGLIEISFLPNCGGAAAKVFTILSTQPALMGRGVAIQGFGAVAKSAEGGGPMRIPGSSFDLRGGHTFIRVKTPSETIICDAFNIRELERKAGPVGICTKEQVLKGKPPACAMFKDKYWSEKKSYGFESALPDVDKFSSRAKKFFHQEMEWQDNRFSEVMGKEGIHKDYTQESPTFT